MSEEQTTTTAVEGEGKVMKFRKRKEEPAAPKAEKAKKEPKVVKEPKEPKVKEPKVPKVKKAALTITAPKGVNVKVATFVTTAISDDATKKLWMRGTTIGLTERVTGLKGFKAVTEEEAKAKHLGKTRCMGKIENQEELDDVVKKFFA